MRVKSDTIWNYFPYLCHPELYMIHSFLSQTFSSEIIRSWLISHICRSFRLLFNHFCVVLSNMFERNFHISMELRKKHLNWFWKKILKRELIERKKSWQFPVFYFFNANDWLNEHARFLEEYVDGRKERTYITLFHNNNCCCCSQTRSDMLRKSTSREQSNESLIPWLLNNIT